MKVVLELGSERLEGPTQPVGWKKLPETRSSIRHILSSFFQIFIDFLFCAGHPVRHAVGRGTGYHLTHHSPIL